MPDWSKQRPSAAAKLNQEVREAVTSPAWLNDECPVTPEDVDNFVEAITNRNGASILERDWNPARHPRVPKGWARMESQTISSAGTIARSKES